MQVERREPQRSSSQPGEVLLLGRVARGDEEALVSLYDTYADSVFRFVLRRVADCYEDAEELTQDTFLAAIACAPTFDGTGSVRTWLCGIAKVRIADFYRRQGRRKRVPPDRVSLLTPGLGEGSVADFGAPGAAEVAERVDAQRLIDRTLEGLREEEREVLLLRYVEEFSVREMSILMKRSEKAVESLLTRAKKKAARAATRWL